MSEKAEKQNVREFYDHIGWSMEADGFYQNARYEDLRPVSAEYIHKCHMRITPYFAQGGKFLLDAGCGPIQYKEYLTYSENFEKRVCADISYTALVEARKRIGEHGFFVVADVANLPFASEVFDGVVSLHTLHHLNLDEQEKAWHCIHRTMKSGSVAVIVNGWTESAMMKKWQPRVLFAEKFGQFIATLRGKNTQKIQNTSPNAGKKATGTFVQKLDAAWVRKVLTSFEDVSFDIRCWRSVSVRWLRALIHKPYGSMALRLLFKLENERPQYYGEYGQYPMIICRKEEENELGR